MSAFEPENERISVYFERVQMFFVAKGIEEDKQVPVFLSVLGAKVYALLRDLLAPAKPSDKSFDDLSDVLTKHFEPKPVVMHLSMLVPTPPPPPGGGEAKQGI